jgi:RHS repeat-associated protein
MRLSRVCALVFFLTSANLVLAQNLATANYAFGSFDNKGFDTVNLGNLNTHFEIPVVNKQGRGMNFVYSLVYDGLVWSPSSSTGTVGWEPDSGWGFHGQLGSRIVGYLSYVNAANAANCISGRQRVPGTLLENWVYHDPFGRSHGIDYKIQTCSNTTVVTKTGTGQTKDGSGYYMTTADEMIHSRSGAIINAPQNPTGTNSTTGSITDTNGNVITNNGNGTFTDTLGVTELTIAGLATQASPVTLTYPVVSQADSASSATATITYKTYTVQTNFQCIGSASTAIPEYPATSIDLIDHITLPDSPLDTYTFSYEVTPGLSNGAVTGRLSSITLPTGGVITYAYSGGCSSSGINNDGTPATLTRTTTDGTKSYARTITAPASTTNVTDENQNPSIYTFVNNTDGYWFETERKIYQGTTPSTLLEDRITQYNGQTTPAQLTAEITTTTVLDSFNGGSQLETDNVYDASGMLTSSTQKSNGTVLESQSNTYNTLEEITASTMADGSGNVFAYSYYGYDETTPTGTSGIPQHVAAPGTRGNLTSTHVSAGSTYLNTTTTYYDTGVPIATTTPNGTTQYSYDSTQAFATMTTLPTPSSGVSLATSASYDPPSGAPLTATGMNAGQTVQIKQYDRLLRPTIVSLPNGGQIQTNYESINQTGLVQSMSSSQNADTETLVDGYGRTIRVAVANGQSSNGWYQVDYCYDHAGNLSFQSTRYQSTGFSAAKQCSGTSYLYDALGRMTSSNNSDGTTTYQYFGRAVRVTDVNGVQKITQYDLLGRISAVCEISSGTSLVGSGSASTCGGTGTPMDIAGTGYTTSYTYDLANHTTTITQGAQQRVFQTDSAGRTIFVNEPERGITTYSYAFNSTGLVVTRKRPKANPNSTGVTTTTTQYDSLNRVVSISYDDGLTPTKTFTYDVSAGWSESQVNLKGKLSQISVSTPNGQAASIFSYDLMGWPYFDISCTPPRCGASIADHGVPYTHDFLGNILTTGDAAGPTYTYTYSRASEVLSITSSQSDSTHPPNLVSNVQNGPNGPVSYQLGNGLGVASAYDALGRLSGQWVCVGVPSIACSAQRYGFNVGARKGSQITNVSDNITGQNTVYGYDEFNRLTSANFGAGAKTFSYVYDLYGNRWQQNAPQGGGLATSFTFPSKNQINTAGYDAAGNLSSDSFHQYTYDAEGNILKVDMGTTAIYAYDALNHRIREDVGSKSTVFVYNAEGQRVSYWNTPNTQLIQGQVYWGSKPVAFRENGEHFQHQDYLGTERMTTNWAGAIDGSFSSLPFDDTFAVTGTDYDQYHFAQLDYDIESMTDHAQFRQYSPTQGRWMSPDPYDGSYDASNPQSFNRYAYVLNNPLAYVDPDGTTGCGGGSSCECDGACPAPDPPPVSDPCVAIGLCAAPPTNPGNSGNPGTQTGSNGGGGGAAPKNGQTPKSPARQKCEQKAQQDYQNSTDPLKANYLSKAKASIVPGIKHGFAVGCVAGAVAASPGTLAASVIGCAAVGADGAAIGAVSEPALSLLDDGLSLSGAYIKYVYQMGVCARTP